MSDDLYRIKKKPGTHLTENPNEDGSITSLQFSDEDNSLQGPVDLVPVQGKTGLDLLFKALTILGTITATLITVDTVTSKKQNKPNFFVRTWNRLFPKKKAEIHQSTKITKSPEKTSLKQNTSVKVSSKNEQDSQKIPHTKAEVDKAIQDIKKAAVIIAAIIKELQNTVIVDGDSDEESIEIQEKLKQISSDETKKQIDFLLEEQNSAILDHETLSILRDFKNNKYTIIQKNQ